MGCVYNNFLLALGESFLIACDRVCLCERPDLITCREKTCPHLAKEEEMLGGSCRLEADPDDPCCQIWICRDEAAQPRSLRRILVEELDLELVDLEGEVHPHWKETTDGAPMI